LRSVVPGQLHERVVKISSSRLNVRDAHSDPRERVDDRRCEVAGTDDGNVGFFPLYLFHARYCIHYLVVDRLGGNKAHPLSSRLCRDDFGRVQHYELAVVDEGEAVAQSLSFVHEVGHEYHGCAAVPDALDECPRLAPRLRVEPSDPIITFWAFSSERPCILVEPEAGTRSQEMHSTAVVLPAPFGPIIL